MRVTRFGSIAVAAMLTMGLTVGARAQAPPTNTAVKDSTPLRPPAGYRVAVVEWQDMECPVCSRAFPIVRQATDDTHAPWVEHDFPIKYHVWSIAAAVAARYIEEAKGRAVADEFRGQIFAAQPYLHTNDDIQTFAQKFAAQHGMQWPFVVDPQGKLRAAVDADEQLGVKVGIDHTPTIFVVTNGRNGAQQYTEVQDYSKLESILQTAIQQVGGLKEAAPVAAKTVKKAAK